LRRGVVVAALPARHGPGKRVEIDDQQVNRPDAEFPHHGVVDSGAAEQGAVHLRVQGLDPAIHDLGKAGDTCDLDHGEARVHERARGAAGREQFEPELSQFAGEFDDAGLVGNAEQRPPGVLLRHLLRRTGRIRAISCAGCRD
jgi:hypothetical protein